MLEAHSETGVVVNKSPDPVIQRKREHALKYAHSEEGKKKRRAYYLKTYQKMIAWRREYRHDVKRRFRAIIEEAKSVPCADCGQIFHHSAMDFYHSWGKKSFKIAEVQSTGDASEEKLYQEISKCRVVCANCHRIKHWKQRHPSVV